LKKSKRQNRSRINQTPKGNTMKKILSICAALVLAGCAITNETTLVVGKARPAISPEQVKIYTTPPDKYEEIALVSADAAHDFMSKQALLDVSIAKIKAEAAKVGANGVILESVGDNYVGSSGVMVMQAANRRAPVVGVGSSNARTGKAVTGKAVYVQP